VPRDKDFKRIVRARMAATGERYTTARSRLLAEGGGTAVPPGQVGSVDSATTFPVSFDRASRVPMAVLHTGPKVAWVRVSASTVDIRLGWAFRATLAREAVASARPLSGGLSQLPPPFRLSVLRGVNYWPRTCLVNGAGTGLVDIILDPPKWVRLGFFRAPVRRLIVSVEDPAGLVAALNASQSRAPGSGNHLPSPSGQELR